MNNSYFLGFLFLLLVGLVMILGMPKQENTSQFVVAKGQDFHLQDKQFRSVGVNRYNLLTHNKPGGAHVGCANSFSEVELDTMFANLQSIGVTTVRFWAFQSFTQNGRDLERLDYVVNTAQKYNIKVIPVLENHWSDCTEAGIKNQEWYVEGYKNHYGAYTLTFKEYISTIVLRYKDNPTIMAWEIINEPRDVDEAVLAAFAGDISQHIKSIDTNHLVSIGMAGAYSSEVLYRSVYEIQTIDYVDYHDYDFENESLPLPLADRIALAKKLNKPLVVGESGIKSDQENRAELFGEKLKEFFKEHGAVYIIWSYGTSSTTNDGFNFGFNDPLSGVLKQVTRQID